MRTEKQWKQVVRHKEELATSSWKPIAADKQDLVPGLVNHQEEPCLPKEPKKASWAPKSTQLMLYSALSFQGAAQEVNDILTVREGAFTYTRAGRRLKLASNYQAQIPSQGIKICKGQGQLDPPMVEIRGCRPKKS